MAAYLVVQINVKDQDGFEKYRAMAAPAISAYGGKYLVRGGIPKNTRKRKICDNGSQLL
jgi:uncharacterized protein (DUF1330 family)